MRLALDGTDELGKPHEASWRAEPRELSCTVLLQALYLWARNRLDFWFFGSSRTLQEVIELE